MTFIRAASLIVLLLLIFVAGGSYYLYQNQALLLEKGIKQFLPELGVEQIHYRGLALARDQFSLESLHIAGQYDGFVYDGELSSILVTFSWRELIQGKLQSVIVQTLQATVAEEASGAPANTVPLVRLSSLLPPLNLDQLPIEKLEMSRWRLDYTAGEQKPLTATGSAQIDDLLQLHLNASRTDITVSANIWTEQKDALPHCLITIKDGDKPVAEIALNLLDTGADRWQWSLEGEVDYATAMSLLRRILPLMPETPDTLIPDGLHLIGKSHLALRIEHDEQLDFSKPFEQTLLDQFHIQGATNNQILQLDIPGVAAGLNATLDVDITLRDGQISASVAPLKLLGELNLEALGLTASTRKSLQWDKSVPIRWINPETLTITGTKNGAWSLWVSGNQFKIGSGATELRLENLSIQADMRLREQIQLTANIQGRINSRLRKNQLPALNITLTQSGSMNDSEFTFALDDVAESMKLSVNGQANLATGRGQYDATLSSQDLAYASETLLPLMRKLKLLTGGNTLSISSGFMELSSDISSSGFKLNDVNQQARLVVGKLSGALGDYHFEGATMNASWTGIDKWRTKSPVSIGINTLNLGFEVLNTRMQLSLPRDTPIGEPLIRVEKFSSTVFGGQVFLPKPQPWDFAAKSNDFTLRAEGWQLADMVALQQSQDIQAGGVLEGELPVTLTDGRLIITDGYLRALPPGGSIRYIANEASKALAASSTELALALDLLSDFQYEVLSTKVNLDDQGELLLGLSLAGKNPSQYEGRPINFNINLEQNLDPLLQSLRLSDKLVEQLESRIH